MLAWQQQGIDVKQQLDESLKRSMSDVKLTEKNQEVANKPQAPRRLDIWRLIPTSLILNWVTST